MRGVMLDTQGPEIRSGNLVGDAKISLVQGSSIEVTVDPVRRDGLVTRGFSANWHPPAVRVFAEESV